MGANLLLTALGTGKAMPDILDNLFKFRPVIGD